MKYVYSAMVIVGLVSLAIGVIGLDALMAFSGGFLAAAGYFAHVEEKPLFFVFAHVSIVFSILSFLY